MNNTPSQKGATTASAARTVSATMESYAVTDVGRMRDNNEDAFDAIPEKEFYVVCDGMGGHASGQVASRIAVENIRRYVTDLYRHPGPEYSFPNPPSATAPERLVSNAIQWANERVFIESMKERQYEGMGTTLVAMMGVGRHLVLGHVGDSRIYRYRQGVLEQVTRDHSLLNHYIDLGKIRTDDEAKNFKETNVIVRAVGLKDYVEPTVRMVERMAGDLYLLCSDGLSDQVSDAVVADLLSKSPSLDASCRKLVDLANLAGGKDNCTVMLVRVLPGAFDDEEDLPKTIRREVPTKRPSPVTDFDDEERTAPSLPAISDDMMDDDDDGPIGGDTEPELPQIHLRGEPEPRPQPLPTAHPRPSGPPSSRRRIDDDDDEKTDPNRQALPFPPDED
jgi:protein phosphatase